MAERQAGMAITLPRDRVRDGHLDPDVRATVIRKATDSIVRDFEQYSTPDGTIGITPRVRFRSEPRRIMFDLIMDMVPAVQALEWRTNKMRLDTFRENVQVGLNAVIDSWIASTHSVVIWADQAECAVTGASR